MLRKIGCRGGGELVAVVAGLLMVTRAETQTVVPRATYPQYQQYPQNPQTPANQPAKVTPRLDPVAETKLLMEGLANPNFRSIDRFLKQKPDSEETWRFMRGQALLLAETANLLMLRPPQNQGQPVWFERAMQMREAAKQLAQATGKGEYERSRALFVNLANTCNRCHQNFRVPVEIVPFQQQAAEKVQATP